MINLNQIDKSSCVVNTTTAQPMLLILSTSDLSSDKLNYHFNNNSNQRRQSNSSKRTLIERFVESKMAIKILLLIVLFLLMINSVICDNNEQSMKQLNCSITTSSSIINHNSSSNLSSNSLPLKTITIQLFNNNISKTKSNSTNKQPLTSTISTVSSTINNFFHNNSMIKFNNNQQNQSLIINSFENSSISDRTLNYSFNEIDSLSLRLDSDNSFVTELYSSNSSHEFNSNDEFDEGFIVDPAKCLHIFSCNLRYSLSWTIVLFVAYLVVFFIGLFGNISVLWIVYMLRREKKRRHSCGAGCGTIYCKSTMNGGGPVPASGGGTGNGTGTPGGTYHKPSVNYQNSLSFHCQHQTHMPIIQISRSNAVFYRFVCNLALADLLVVLFCLPPTLIGNIYLPWVLGRVVCKAVPYLQGVSVNASVYTLVAISIDRFYAIYYPLNKKCSTALCWTTILLIWSLSFAISLPWLIYFDVIPLDAQDYPTLNNGHSVQICRDIWPSIEMENGHFLVVNLGFQYLIPLSIIALFYILILKKIAERKLPKLARHLPANVKDGNRQSSLVIERSKVKVFKMLIVLVLLFALSWLPLYVIFFMIKIGPRIDEQSWTSQILHTGVPVAQWLGASNSCVNPVLYFFFNAKFRSYYRMTWLKTFSCLSVLRPSAMMGPARNLNGQPNNHINNDDKSTVTAV